MTEENKKNRSTKKGVESSILITGLALVLGIFLIITIVLTMNLNSLAADLVDKVQTYSEYQQSATMLQTGTSILSETCTSFVQMPAVPSGEGGVKLNMNPLTFYAQELDEERRPSEIVEIFEGYDVSDEIKGYIKGAAGLSTQMQEIQTHALSLIFSVYDLPDDPVFNTLRGRLIALTAEEQAMPDDARLALSKQLISSKDYSLLKSDVGGGVEKCHEILHNEINELYAQGQKNIVNTRTAQWIVIALMATNMVVAFVFFFLWIVGPIQRYESDMKGDRPLKPIGQVRELASMVNAYNEVLARRNQLEGMLRAAAETDALTGLSNRYSLEQNTMDIDRAEGSLAVVHFDVNFLKKVNDTLGHLKGDQLLKTSADCIKECFGVDKGDNCYRFGGDEFAAILQGFTEEDVRNRIKVFVEKTAKERVSVSVGYAFDGEPKDGRFQKLWKLADKNMYENKKEIHKKCSEDDV